ncbi:MAG: low molecular weight phosphotyrosine protein phosphatase [Nitriliruptorales bacterium]|nr:low molecular weight phosphotyrosine protein phosphatase [Nitriliruptorales bacterium]
MRILLVCLGNICRSPTAEAAIREALAEAGLEQSIEVDSAGTGTWHLGEPPDPRMAAAAAEAGLDLSGRARQVSVDDFAEFDLILVMDRSNLEDVRGLAPDMRARERVRLFRTFEDGADGDEVPDPYYGGTGGFERVVEITRRGAQGLVDWIRAGGLERAADRVG